MPTNLQFDIPLHLRIAFSQLGVKEYEGDPSNPQIEDYLKSVWLPSDDKIPWCAAFVTWCLEQADIKGTGSGLARSFLSWSESLAEPELGCIVVIKRGLSSTTGHVFFYLDESLGFITGIGGNQVDRVGVNSYSKLRLLGYRRVV